MRSMPIGFAVLLATTCAAFAEQPLYPTQDCNKAVVQMEINMCAGANYESADRALNETYRELLAAQPDEQSRARLREAERAWIAYRDKTCASEVGPQEGGGSIWPMDMSTCLEAKTAARLRVLKRSLACPEGPNDCPR